MTHRQLALVAVGCLTITGGCSESLRTAATPADDAGFTATVVQYRDQVVSNQVSITVTNGGPADRHLRSLQLAWPALEPMPPDPLDYTVFRGVRVDLPVEVGEAVCSDPPGFDEAPPPGPILAAATTDDGPITFAIDDTGGVLADIHRRSCARQAVEHAITFELGPITDAGSDPPTAGAELVVTRGASTEPIELGDLGGSVVVDVAYGNDEHALAADQHQVRVPLVFTNARCDPHARSETKQPFVFPLQLRIGDRDIAYTLQPDKVGKDALTALILDRCPDLTGI